MATDHQPQTDDRIDTSDTDGEPPATGATNGVSAAPVTEPDHVPVTALLAEEHTVPFVGLTDATATRARGTQPISPELRCGDDEPLSLKEAISILPRASSGELWATNEFVATDGTVDADAIKSVHGLDAERFDREIRLGSGRPSDDARRARVPAVGFQSPTLTAHRTSRRVRGVLGIEYPSGVS